MCTDSSAARRKWIVMLKSRLRSREDVTTLRERYLGPREDLTSILINARQEQKSTFGALLAPIFAAATAASRRRGSTEAPGVPTTPTAAAPSAGAAAAAAAAATPVPILVEAPALPAATPKRTTPWTMGRLEPRPTGSPFVNARDVPPRRRVSTSTPSTSGLLPLVMRRPSLSDPSDGVGGPSAAAFSLLALTPVPREDVHHAGSDSEDTASTR